MAVLQVLGPTAVRTDDGASARLSRTQRVLLCRLALGGVVRFDALINVVWPGGAPATARASLQNQVARLRAALGADAIETRDDGYRLTLPTDAELGRRLVLRAERAHADGDPEATLAACTEALELVTGEPYSDLSELTDVPDAALARRSVHTWTRAAEDLRVEAALDLGRTALAVLQAEDLYRREPLDEGRAALLVRCLAAAGRRGDALAVIDRAREALRTELGLDASRDLMALHASLLEPTPTPDRARGRFVGREAPLRAVHRVLDDDGSAVVVAEAGGGVTRFLRELAAGLRRAPGSVALSAAGPDAWRPGRELTEICEQLRITLDDALGPFRGFLPALAGAERPVTILADDAELLGPSSRLVIERAVALPGVRVVLGGHEIAPPEGFTSIELPRLGPDAVDRLVQEWCGPTDAHSRAALLADSGGNPDLLTSLLLDDRVVAWLRDPTLHTAPMSTTLLDRVQLRLSQLTAPARAALDVLAIAGPHFTRTDIGHLVTSAGIAELEAAGLVEGTAHRLAVRWEALRRGVVASMPAGRRAEIHHAIAEALPLLPVAVLARHRRESASIDPAAAVDALVEAAREVTRVGAHDDAVGWLRQARAVVREHADVVGVDVDVEVSIQLGDAMRLAGMPEHVEVLVDAAERAEALSGDVWSRAAYALLQLGATTESGGVHAAVEQVTERLEASPPADDDGVAALAAASLAWSMTGDDERPRALFTAAEARAASPAARRAVLPFAYLALGHPRDTDRRHALGLELETLGREADDAVAVYEALHLQFSNALIRPAAEGRRAALVEMRAMIDRVGDVGRRWALQYQEATAAHLDGRDDDAERFAERGLDLFEPVSPSRAFAAYASQLLALRITQGRVEELAPVVAGLVAEQPGVRAWQAVAALTLARTDPAAALDHAERALSATDSDFTWLAAHVIGGRAVAVAGGAGLAPAYLERLAPWSGYGCWQGNCSLGPVDTALALLSRTTGDGVASRRYASRARAIARDLGSVPHEQEIDALEQAGR